MAKNPKSVNDYKNGKQAAMGALIGQTMRACGSKFNPTVLNQVLLDELSK